MLVVPALVLVGHYWPTIRRWNVRLVARMSICAGLPRPIASSCMARQLSSGALSKRAVIHHKTSKHTSMTDEGADSKNKSTPDKKWPMALS